VRRLRPEDLQPTDEERQLTRTASGAEGQGAAVGGGIGTALGSVAGGALGTVALPGLGTAAGAGLGASLGGTLGSLIGGGLGGKQAESADQKLQKIDEERQRRLAEYQLHQQALDDLLAMG